MKLVCFPTYPFQLALTNLAIMQPIGNPQSAAIARAGERGSGARNATAAWQLVLKHHCMLLLCNAACVRPAQRH